ncbi:MAG TPA: hypothetical protein PKN28_00560, partial [Clostridiales bacterium]|nr:hypothetical protein [Clostridiales bacterium]
KGEDMNLIKSRQEELTNKFYEISEKLYKTSADAANAANSANAQGSPDTDGYYEAPYTDVPNDENQ